MKPGLFGRVSISAAQDFGQCSGWSRAMVLVSVTTLRALGKRSRVDHDFLFVVESVRARTIDRE
jgi:hypothetical protein